jgi:hypothetical protein
MLLEGNNAMSDSASVSSQPLFGQYLYNRGYVGVQTIVLAINKQRQEGGARKLGTILLEDFNVFKSQSDLDRVFAEYERDVEKEAPLEGVTLPRKPLDEILEELLRDIDYYDIAKAGQIIKALEALRSKIFELHGLL